MAPEKRRKVVQKEETQENQPEILPLSKEDVLPTIAPTQNVIADNQHNPYPTSKIIRFLILKSIGNFLILFALFGVSMTIGPALYYEIRYRVDQATGIQYVVSNPTTTTSISQLGKIQNTPHEKILTPPNTLFSIVIPKIGASAQVIPNVDAGDPTDYLAALKKGIAHAKGSVFPGMKGTSFFFAHSTDNFWDVGRYNAVFYLLKDMTVGDSIAIFYNNYRYNYTVTDTKILDPSDVSLLVNAQKDTEEKIVLQTCWPPGTTWKRFIVIAKPVKS